MTKNIKSTAPPPIDWQAQVTPGANPVYQYAAIEAIQTGADPAQCDVQYGHKVNDRHFTH